MKITSWWRVGGLVAAVMVRTDPADDAIAAAANRSTTTLDVQNLQDFQTRPRSEYLRTYHELV